MVDVKSLLLVVVVLSPGSRRTDRIVKRDFYLANGVAEYWIVDVDERSVERWKSMQESAELCRDSIAWAPLDREPLLINLEGLFTRIETQWRWMQR